LAKEAGVPDGVLNLVHGDKVAVNRLLEHPDIKAISFVGSTPLQNTFTRRQRAMASECKRLAARRITCLCLPDADISMAADAAVSAGYGAAGERCMAISVVLAVGNVADPLIDAIRERVARIKVGPGSEPKNEMGPLISREHRDRVASYLDGAVAEGATLPVDGRLNPATNGDGYFLGPSLIDHAKPGMRCYDHEIFGPVLSVVRVDTYAEALRLINDNPFGNGTAIFTQNGGAARQFQFDVEVGMVGINVPIPVPVSYYSFGGWKSSLFGDLHMYGPEGVQFYTRSKVVTSRWPDPGASKVDLGFPQVR
jgi:malonate-semialdehyde dehydrogenase (acetylating)/methylmalonate-semialdehyde dehydrogenase